MSVTEHVVMISDQRSSLCHPTNLLLLRIIQIFQEHQLNLRTFPVFPGDILNSSRFSVVPEVVDTLLPKRPGPPGTGSPREWGPRGLGHPETWSPGTSLPGTGSLRVWDLQAEPLKIAATGCIDSHLHTEIMNFIFTQHTAH